MHCQVSEGAVETFFENDPYIPMNIRFGDEDLEVDRMGIYGSDGDLLEIAASLATREMRELTLVHCGNFAIVEREMDVPDTESGVVRIEMPDHVDAECFLLEVFLDGLHFKLADNCACEYLRNGNVVLGLSKGSDFIAEVFVLDLSSENVDAVVSTLEYYRSQKDVVLYMDDSPEK